MSNHSLVPLFALLAAAACVPQKSTVPVERGFPVGRRIMNPGRGDVVVALDATAHLHFFAPGEQLHGERRWLDFEEAPAVEILRASSSAPDVVQIVGSEGSRVTVKARRRGNATLALETSRGASEIAVHVAEPASVELSHESVDLEPETPRVFLRGGVARMRFVARDAGGRVLVGWGSPVPIRVDPPGAALVTTPEGSVDRVDVAIEDGEAIALRPLGGPAVEMAIVEPGGPLSVGVAALTTPPATEPLVAMRRGEPRTVIVGVSTAEGRRVFGIVGRTRLVSHTPDTCEVEPAEDWYSEGAYNVKPIAAGECQIEAGFGEVGMALTVPVE